MKLEIILETWSFSKLAFTEQLLCIVLGSEKSKDE